MSDELLPCPFCGDLSPFIESIRDGLRATCVKCFADGPVLFYGPESREITRAAVTAAWNKPPREPDPLLAQMAEALKSAVIHLAAVGHPVNKRGNYDKDGEWTFTSAVPDPVDACSVLEAFTVISAALSAYNARTP